MNGKNTSSEEIPVGRNFSRQTCLAWTAQCRGRPGALLQDSKSIQARRNRMVRTL